MPKGSKKVVCLLLVLALQIKIGDLVNYCSMGALFVVGSTFYFEF